MWFYNKFNFDLVIPLVQINLYVISGEVMVPDSSRQGKLSQQILYFSLKPPLFIITYFLEGKYRFATK